jgi:hypothetical protein
MTDTESFFYDQKYLFLDNIYSPNQPAREAVTTFAVKRNTFKSFFLEFEKDENLNINRQPVQNCQNTPSQGVLATRVENEMDMELFSTGDRTATENETNMELFSAEGHTTTEDETAMELFSAEGHTSTGHNSDTNIVWQSSEACRWTFAVSPDDFYMSCRPLLQSLTGVIFCDVMKKEALSFRSASAASGFPTFIDISSIWFAQVEESSSTINLRTLTRNQVFAKCVGGSCIIFHGKHGSFKPKLSPSEIVTPVLLPTYDQGHWILK